MRSTYQPKCRWMAGVTRNTISDTMTGVMTSVRCHVSHVLVSGIRT